MHILVTNDDGVESPGLWHLAAALQRAGLGMVTVIAPDRERSGTGMSVPPEPEAELIPTAPPAPEFEGLSAWAFTGTPAGCVTVAMLEVVAPRPDVVVAGINPGLNTGGNVMVSGTVGAAMTGSLWGIPGMAVSVDFARAAPVNWTIPGQVATRVFPLLRMFDPREGGHSPLVLNVNVPRVPAASALRGIRQTTLAEIFFGTVMRVGEVIPNGRDGHRLRFAFDRDRLPRDVAPHLDFGAIEAGYVSVTPLAPVGVHPHLDLEAALTRIEIESD